MPTDPPPPSPPRRKPNALRWIIAALALLVAALLFRTFGPNPPIHVSKETTFITEPLGPDGLPDFRQYLLDKYREGVTPDNNAAVPMWNVFGPGKESHALSAEDWRSLSVELKLQPMDGTSSYITPLLSNECQYKLSAWLDQKLPRPERKPDADEPETFPVASDDDERDPWNLIVAAMSGPWRSNQIPPLAEFIQENQRHLDVLVAAATLPKLYSPPPIMLNRPKVGLLEGLSFQHCENMREIARILALRAMNHLGEGRHDAAWEDLLAIYRWSRLAGQGCFDIERIIAGAMEYTALSGTIALLSEKTLSSQLARRIHQELATLRPLPQFADTIDIGGRLVYLDTVMGASNRGMLNVADSYRSADGEKMPLEYMRLNWNVPLAEGNLHYDRLVALCRISNPQQRDKAFNAYFEDIDKLESRIESRLAWWSAAVSPKDRNELLASIFLAAMSPAMSANLYHQDAVATKLDLVRLAAAIAVYRAENGDYPDSLEVLSPVIVAQLPVDIFHSKPFIYRMDGDGYLLYSAGDNAVDDGGNNELESVLNGRNLKAMWPVERNAEEAKIPAFSDDYAIRIPSPQFALPTSTAE